MNPIIASFLQSILPIGLVLIIGVLFRSRFTLDHRSLSRASFNLLIPALIFQVLYSSKITITNSAGMIGASIALPLLMMFIGWLVGVIGGYGRSQRAAIILTTAFVNAGNYGLTICASVFPEEGLAWASLFFVTNIVMLLSLGVVVAEVGRRPDIRALKEVLRVPALYAMALAFILNGLRLNLPQVLLETIDILAAGAIPIMLLVFGLQIAEYGIPNQWRTSLSISALRLIASPIVMLLLVSLFSLEGLASDVALLQSGMPVAVLIGVISAEYELEEDLVASSILISTLLSPISLSILIVLLGVA